MSKLVFGYGSLMNRESLLSTVPTATDIRPAIIKGFTRDFSVWDEEGWVSTNLDVTGKPFCALDVQTTDDPEALVNGIIFAIPDEDLPKLLAREHDYTTIRTTAYDFVTQQPIGETIVFSSGKNNGQYDKNSLAQQRYWDVCLAAAREYGDDFYQMFIDTTRLPFDLNVGKEKLK